ncbi:MAG: hypothetical protein KKA65_03895 [Nanoarchaeota archaeon]|nr:hypothetical protein [Nanoarchaeota archaeon]MBU4351579.1 hypothetical protein [Nanoarchaeota archaeon]MBU4456620.1 hypothetical protein [Nanoarchaeota archaeon]
MSQLDSTLARWIVKEGVNSFDASMLSEQMRKEVFTSAGLLFFRQNNYRDAISCLQIAGNKEVLCELGDELMEINRFREAALAYIPTKDKKRLDKVAAICAKEGEYKLALEAYKASGNIEMASFINKNLY